MARNLPPSRRMPKRGGGGARQEGDIRREGGAGQAGSPLFFRPRNAPL